MDKVILMARLRVYLAEANKLRKQALAFDNLPMDCMFTVFSSHNPWVGMLDETMEQVQATHMLLRDVLPA